MPLRIVLYFAAQLAVCIYALWRGGAPERLTAWIMALAGATTALVPFDPAISFITINQGGLAIDITMLVVLTALAMKADRYWPLWVAALQLLAIAIHIVRGIDPTILPTVYNRSVARLAYPMMLLLVIGTARHARRTRFALEPDWSPLRW